MNDGVTQIIERPAQMYGEQLAALLRDPAITDKAELVKVIMQMRKEVIQDEAKEAYQHAYAAFAAELPPVERDGMVDLGAKGKYPFTTYEQMDAIIRPLLVKHGLSLQFWSSDPERIDAVIIHGALIGWGWQREAIYPVPPDTGPGRNALQARGSAQSYAKRYITDLLCNIVRKGQDNDGRGAVDGFITDKQVKEITDLIVKTGTDPVSFLNVMVTDAKDISDIKTKDFPRLMLALTERLKKQVRKEVSK